MTGRPEHESVDALLDAFIAAWHAGQAPDAAGYVARAAADDRDELEQLLGAFLQLAPTTSPTPERSAELAADPLLQRLASLEGELALADAVAADDPLAGTEEAPFGARLRALREAAGLTPHGLARGFAERFGLAGADAERAPQALAALETGELPADGVAARAARALEELLRAPRGALAGGPSPAFGGPLLRAALPDGEQERAQFTDLLRDVDDALGEHAPAGEPAESLQSLLGA